MAKILDGQALAQTIHAELKERINALKKKGITPGLSVVLVGEDPGSMSYVGMKEKDCAKLGIQSFPVRFAKNAPAEQLLEKIAELNDNKAVNGILVQHPIPNVKNEEIVFNSIAPEKDVDCFHAFNVGRLVKGGALFSPCTPAGVMVLLNRNGIDVTGKHAVVVGRSNIVGKPLANMLLQKAKGANATVTVVHTGTPDIKMFTRQADILIVAAGRPNAVTGADIKEGAVVVDVGVNRVDDPKSPKGYRLIGDVDYESVSKKASYITPVPGGVGPMTRAMLMFNTVLAAENAAG